MAWSLTPNKPWKLIPVQQGKHSGIIGTPPLREDLRDTVIDMPIPTTPEQFYEVMGFLVKKANNLGLDGQAIASIHLCSREGFPLLTQIHFRHETLVENLK
jgi:hypothetical protein